MMRQYILDGHKPVPCEDLFEWNRWLENPKHKKIALTERGNVRVSTIFLGLDRQHGDGPPLLFETVVFGGKHDQECRRYSTWDEAQVGHKATCWEVFGG